MAVGAPGCPVVGFQLISDGWSLEPPKSGQKAHTNGGGIVPEWLQIPT